ncbi:6-phosphogluconolactonase [Paraferrimonas sedimenticola]|uniref:6-phosphogluconolactonase n=1 Tax=Paraferrimonas sedimenticola TaxID=375674 RepID=A0AA37RZK8_9GAMM|nr:6-phosphogluconolactonase [Paraferrimonas sedimenticola]GLP97953.1 6-phosphogluconolactonase [Paraferrimonas sedimenticola]
MVNVPVFKQFDDRNELADKLAGKIAAQLQESIDNNGKASLLVSGGSTPLALFKRLSQTAIEWRKVYVSLVDERWVAKEHADSNERLIRKYFLQNLAASAKFVGLKNMYDTPETGVPMTEDHLASFPRPFDVVVLGMGNDGHTASWFPCSQEIDQALSTDSLLLAVNPGAAPHPRISFSAKAIENARQIYLHLHGDDKLATLEKALEGDDVKAMPIRYILQHKSAAFDVYWSK